MDAIAEALADVLPDGAVITDRDLLEGYRHDRAAWVEGGVPAVAVRPRTTEQVAAVLRVASSRRVPVVPRGAGSGLSGGASATDGCVVLSLETMDRVRSVAVVDQLADVEAGVLNASVAEAVAEHGLWYAPDPASRTFSTIGGNIATNAGGLCCVKYGVTRDHVLGLEVVLADGRVLRTGRRTVKGVAGYDLTGLFVGSEGTLGVVTAATLRLLPRPAPPATAVAVFDRLPDAGRAIAALTASVRPSLLELMDHTTIAAVEAWTPMGLDRSAAALLLAQSDATGDARRVEVEAIAATCDARGASYVAVTEDPDEGAGLLAARRHAYPALEQLGDTLLDDVAVPRSRVIDLLATVEAVADRWEVTIGTFGHAGDGNLHPTIVVPRGDSDAARRARRAFDDILSAALELGGTITGEHGVGLLKRAHLAGELGPGVLAAQLEIKRALDPHGILNPGKAV